jgi:hypothetical protein
MHCSRFSSIHSPVLLEAGRSYFNVVMPKVAATTINRFSGADQSAFLVELKEQKY